MPFLATAVPSFDERSTPKRVTTAPLTGQSSAPRNGRKGSAGAAPAPARTPWRPAWPARRPARRPVARSGPVARRSAPPGPRGPRPPELPPRPMRVRRPRAWPPRRAGPPVPCAPRAATRRSSDARAPADGRARRARRPCDTPAHVADIVDAEQQPEIAAASQLVDLTQARGQAGTCAACARSRASDVRWSSPVPPWRPPGPPWPRCCSSSRMSRSTSRRRSSTSSVFSAASSCSASACRARSRSEARRWASWAEEPVEAASRPATATITMARWREGTRVGSGSPSAAT